MKEVKITDKQKLVELFMWSLDGASILSKEVGKMVEAIHKNLEPKNITDEDKYMEELNQGMADLILQRYEAVIVTSDERVLGRNGNVDEPIFDATDRKVFMDAGGVY